MSEFSDRLELDKRMRAIAVEFFETHLAEKVFFRSIGVEETLIDIHEHIRFKRDLTTEFVRYAPDGIVCWNKNSPHESILLEFKTAVTGFRLDNAKPIQTMRQRVPDLAKEEIANVELGSFNNLIRLHAMEINVALWMYVAYHRTSKWLCVIPHENLNLLPYHSSEMRSTRGSGTPIANLFVRVNGETVFDLTNWIETQFELPAEEIRSFFDAKEGQLLEAAR